MTSTQMKTWFHLPDGEKNFKPALIAGGPDEGKGGGVVGIVALPVGTLVTLHGVDGEFEVVREHFHWGQDDEQSGLHIFLRSRAAPGTASPGTAPPPQGERATYR